MAKAKKVQNLSVLLLVALWSLICCFLLFKAFFGVSNKVPTSQLVPKVMGKVSEQVLQRNVQGVYEFNEPGEERLEAYSTLDPELQKTSQKLFEQTRPDFAAAVLVDSTSGSIRVLKDYSRAPHPWGNLSLRALCPAASLLKIVTSTASMDKEVLDPYSKLFYRGSQHTLYRNNLHIRENPRENNSTTLKDAFAYSINTVFGQLGIYSLTRQDHWRYANRYYLGRRLQSDLWIEPSVYETQASSLFQIAEQASGFTKQVVISPVQAVMLAMAASDEGELYKPRFIEKVIEPNSSKLLYEGSPEFLGRVMSPLSSMKLRMLMKETILSGTSRASFRGRWPWLKQYYQEIGGKTGTLKSPYLGAKCDWFVGFANAYGQRYSLAVLTAHKEQWVVKSSWVARMIFEEIARRELKKINRSTAVHRK